MRPQDDQIGHLLRIVGPREPAPVRREERVKDVVRQVWLEEVRHRRRRRGLAWASGGLALAALLLLTVGLRYGIFEIWNDGIAPAARQPVAMMADEKLYIGDEIRADTRMALRLASGPFVRLDVGTRLRLDSAAALTLEAGTVYIDTEGAIDSQGGNPILEVHTAFGIARDIGTQFEVRATADSLRLRVREGKVLLEGKTQGDGSVHEAEPGDELTVDASGDVTRVSVTPHDASWNWIHDAAPAWDPEGRSLEEILHWISRETGFAVHYGDRAVVEAKLSSRFHGSMPSLRPDQAADVLLPTFGLIAHQENGTLRIESY